MAKKAFPISATGLVINRPCDLVAVLLVGGGVAPGAGNVLVLRDGNDINAAVRFGMRVPENDSRLFDLNGMELERFTNGIFAQLSGAGTPRAAVWIKGLA